MRWHAASILIACALPLAAQSGSPRTGIQGGPAPGPSRSVVSSQPISPAPARGARPLGPRRVWGGWGGWWWGGYPEPRSTPPPAPLPEPKEDRLKELIISPVYTPPKINPKLIEIP